jgi:opacity protein-like surface antigen
MNQYSFFLARQISDMYDHEYLNEDTEITENCFLDGCVMEVGHKVDQFTLSMKEKDMKFSNIVLAGLTLGLVALPASAQEWYAGGSFGILNQSDSDNSGSTGAFTTGNLGDGSTLDVAAGTPYGWNTQFENGYAVSGEIGLRYGNGLRSGIEVSQTSADVDTHKAVTLGGGSIDGVDAAAIAGSPAPLGVTVADVVADGRGDISSTSLFFNAYYDFNRAGTVQPYVGGGIGLSDVNVTYQPSGIGVIDDGETKFSYQLKAGLTWQATPQWDFYGEYAYRATDDIETKNDLFPGSLNIENQQNIFSIGIRYRFGA